LPDTSPQVLIAGVSTRAAAESAARAGFRVTAIDAFADLDQHPSVTARAVPGRFSASAAARAARSIECDAVSYLSSFENHPRAIATLSQGRELWGNPPEVIGRVRDPLALAQALRRRGLITPDVYREPRPGNENAENRNREPGWLLKPLASGGGRRVRRWRPGSRMPRGAYLQEYVAGDPGSVVFVSAAGRCVPLGVSRQLVGDPAFGATGYQYCGSILVPGRVNRDALELSRAVAEEFNVVGVNGIDFIEHEGRACAIEVNPRWSASMELVELAHGLSVFGAHAAACARGELPDFDLSVAAERSGAIGKAVVFARRDVVIGDTRRWRFDVPGLPALPGLPGLRDIPHPGERIAAGRPVCTIFASGRDIATCHAALVERATQVYAALAAWSREVA
jgi:predicted ATP-grasp superfamily ATP-dependent carboligase